MLIASRFANLLGGGLTAAPRESGGSTFRFEIRADLANDNDVERDLLSDDELGGHPLRGKTIFVVEDCESISMFLRRLLEYAGARVMHAEDGRKGLTGILERIGENDAPDLVLLDMAMPEMDGYQVVRELRMRGAEFPIVAMTAFALEQDRQKCLDAGCSSYIAKPISPRSFLRTMVRMLTESRPSRTDVG